MKYLDHLFRDCGIVELRHELNKRWLTHWFGDADDFRNKACRLLDRGNLFTSLHRPAHRPDGPLKNEHVTRYTRLLFDMDPTRPTGVSSTDDELAFSEKAANQLQRALRAWGWPEPLQAMSGNGRHLQYRAALPNDDATRQMLTTLYAGMKREFSDERASFDPTVKNPGRICALYGTTKRKGENTKGRPHRQSQAWIPDPWRQVTPRQVEAVANFYAKQQPTAEIYRPDFRQSSRVTGKGDYQTLNVVAWFTAHGLYEHHIEGNKHAVVCPWEAEHSAPGRNDTLIFEGDGSGWPGFYCHHSHCHDRQIRDVMQVMGDADVFCGRGFGGAA